MKAVTTEIKATITMLNRIEKLKRRVAQLEAKTKDEAPNAINAKTRS
jgi:BMFP domain-containing protein YqiC